MPWPGWGAWPDQDNQAHNPATNVEVPNLIPLRLELEIAADQPDLGHPFDKGGMSTSYTEPVRY